MRHTNPSRLRTLLTATLAAALLTMATPGAAQLTCPLGDCDADGTVAIFEVQQCINLFLGPSFGFGCRRCSTSGEGFGIVDLQKLVNCYLDSGDPSCLQIPCDDQLFP